MLIDRRDFLGASSRSPDPVKATSYSETIQSAYNTTAATERATSLTSALRTRYSELQSYIQEQTGTKLTNPIDYRSERAVRLEHMFRHGRALSTQKEFGQTTQDFRESTFFDEAIKLREEYPDLDIPTAEEIREQIGRDRAELRETDAERARGESGFVQGAARVAGGIGAILLDPPVYTSMLLGAGAARGLVQAALIEGAIGVGVEIPIQAAVQGQRPEVGEEPSLAEAAINVTMAGLGGAIGAAALRGTGLGVRELLRRYRAGPRTPSGDFGAAYLERMEDIRESNPFEDTPAGNDAFQKRFDEASERLLEPELARGVDNEALPTRAGLEVLNERRPGVTREVVTAEADLGLVRRRLARQQRVAQQDVVDIARSVGGEPKRSEQAVEAARDGQTSARADVEQLQSETLPALQRQAAELDEASPEYFAVQEQIAEARQRLQTSQEVADSPLEDLLESAQPENIRLARNRQSRARREIETLQAETIPAAVRRVALAREQQAAALRILQATPEVRMQIRDIQNAMADTDLATDVAGMQEAGQASRRIPESSPGLAEDVPGSTGTGNREAVSDLLAPEDVGTQRAVREALEQSVLQLLEENPTRPISILNDAGEVRTLSAQQILDEFRDDIEFQARVAECVRGVI